jgi:hypothetical protein
MHPFGAQMIEKAMDVLDHCRSVGIRRVGLVTSAMTALVERDDAKSGTDECVKRARIDVKAVRGPAETVQQDDERAVAAGDISKAHAIRFEAAAFGRR